MQQSGSRCRRGTNVRAQAIDSAISVQLIRRETRKPPRVGSEKVTDGEIAFPFACSACTTRSASRATTIGVRTTANAKLNISARDFTTPQEHPGRDRGTRPRESTKRQTESLHGSYNPRFSSVQIVCSTQTFSRFPLLDDTCHENQDSQELAREQ